MRETVTIGTRGSKLALWQAHAVRDALLRTCPGIEVEVRVISTTGDRVLDVPLEKIGDKGLFTKELEVALQTGLVDLCVHSMKDMPTELPEGCAIIAMLPREDARDTLVCGPRISGCTGLAQIPAGARLGTGSLRRTAQLRARFPQVEPSPIRGNVDTRLAKSEGADYEGAILAAAGLLRLGMEDRITAFIPIDDMVPAVGQGAIGIEARADDARIASLCSRVNDPSTFACVNAERQVLEALEGGCQAPIGVHARYEEGTLVLDATVLLPDGSQEARVQVRADGECDPSALATRAVAALEERGARGILAQLGQREGDIVDG